MDIRRIIVAAAAAAFIPYGDVYAAEEKPEAHIYKMDGYTEVYFDTPHPGTDTFAVNGDPRCGEVYRGQPIIMTEDGIIRMRVKTDGKATNYVFRIDVNEKHIIKPRALEKGDTIGVVAPARYLDEDISGAVAMLEDMGYSVKLGQSCSLRYNGYAGTPKQRAADINAFFADDEVDAVLCLRGGAGSMDILDLIDYDIIKEDPKLFIGFSDITALHSAIYNKCGLVTIHGPMLSNLALEHTEYTVAQLRDGLDGDITEPTFPEGAELTALSMGTAQGRIAGGNLSRMCDLIGTPYEPNTAGAIIVIEDTHESAQSIENKLDKLIDSRMIDKCSGIIFGEFTDSADSYGKTWQDVIEKFAAECGKPCAMGLPIGHDPDNMFLPLGIRAELSCTEDGAQLVFLDDIYAQT